MVKGKLYKVANLHKNKWSNYLISGQDFGPGQRGILGPRDQTTAKRASSLGWGCFQDGDVFVCLGTEKIRSATYVDYYGTDFWYNVVDAAGKIHRISPSMRKRYIRNP